MPNFDNKKNEAYGTISTPPSPVSSGLTLILNSGDGLKMPSVPFQATVAPANTKPTDTNSTIIRVTAKSTDTLTFSRTSESSTDMDILAGMQLFNCISVKAFQDLENSLNYAADSGSANVYAVTLAPVPTAYTAGQIVLFKAATANTGASTLNVNGLGAKAIKKSVSTALTTGDIVVGQMVAVMYDGTNFQMIAGAASTAVSLVYNVKDYGATGDDSTDDTTAIQNAINAANTANGGIVFFPQGTYKITDVLTMKSYVSLRGVADSSVTGGSTIKQVTTNKDGIRVTNTTTSNTNMTFENLRLEGTGSGTGHGIYFKNTGSAGTYPPFTYCSFQDLFIQSFGGYGMKVESLIVSVIERVICETCTAGGFFLNGDAAGTGYSTVNTSVTLSSCYANGCTAGNGYNIESSTYIALVACAADDNAIGYLTNLSNVINFSACGAEYGNPSSASPGDSYKVTNSQNVTFDACYSYQNKHIAWTIHTNSLNITMISCQENSPVGATSSLDVDGGSNVVNINSTFVTATAGTGLVTILGATRLVLPQFTLTDGANISLDASAANEFYVALLGNRTFDVPTNAKEGQIIRICAFASGGARTPTFTGGVGGYRAGPWTISAIASGKSDYFEYRYNSTDSKWDLLNYQKGY